MQGLCDCPSLLPQRQPTPAPAPASFPRTACTATRYYVIIVQYTARLHAEKLKTFIHRLNEGVGKQYFNMRLAPEAVSDALSGYEHNAGGVAFQEPGHKFQDMAGVLRRKKGAWAPEAASNALLDPPCLTTYVLPTQHPTVTPFGMKVPDLPVIISHRITHLTPDFFFLGGGEVDLKVGGECRGSKQKVAGGRLRSVCMGLERLHGQLAAMGPRWTSRWAPGVLRECLRGQGAEQACTGTERLDWAAAWGQTLGRLS